MFLLKVEEINAQHEQSQPTLGDFFEKLAMVKPIKENLKYDTFPGFDFAKFKPLNGSSVDGQASFVIGSDVDKNIRTIAIFSDGTRLGVMSVYDLHTFKILTLKKDRVFLSELPDFPILCISSDPFIVNLNKRFQYNQKYQVRDIASIQILRDDLFPVWTLTIRDKYIRMLEDVSYATDNIKVIESVRTIFVFQAEKDQNLLITNKRQFTEEFIVPKADFTINMRPKVMGDRAMPYWFFTNCFYYE
jgi:hypothetical protein